VTYDNYREWKRWGFDAFGTFSHGESIYFDAELSRCGVNELARMRVLEMGFGNGAFAGWVTRKGAVYKGVEVIPELVLRGREEGFDVYQGHLPLSSIAENSSLDIVIALDVFEHLDQSELREILHSVHDALKLGGWLIARVPSGDSPFARSIQHGDLTHCSTLGSSAVHQLAASTGFLVEQVREPVFPLLGYGAMSFMRRGFIKLARTLVYPIVTRLFMGGGSPVLSPNMVFVLRKRQGIS